MQSKTDTSLKPSCVKDAAVQGAALIHGHSYTICTDTRSLDAVTFSLGRARPVGKEATCEGKHRLISRGLGGSQSARRLQAGLGGIHHQGGKLLACFPLWPDTGHQDEPSLPDAVFELGGHFNRVR